MSAVALRTFWWLLEPSEVDGLLPGPLLLLALAVAG